jgi:hypothetical protein
VGDKKMVEDIKKIEIEINALTAILSSLEQEYEQGDIDIGRYLKIRTNSPNDTKGCHQSCRIPHLGCINYVWT